MRRILCVFLLGFFAITATKATDRAELKERRQRAAKAFPDGVLLLHSRAAIEYEADGYRENPAFFYLTGLENAQPAILAIDGKSGESWLFIAEVQMRTGGEANWEVKPGGESAEHLGIEHVEDWTKLEKFLGDRARSGTKVYYQRAEEELPPNL